MARSSTPSFTVERRMYVQKYQERWLEKKFNISNKIYNTAVKHYRKQINRLYNDPRYIASFEAYKAEKDKKKRRKYAKEISDLMKEYKLNEYDIHKFVCSHRNRAFRKSISAFMTQKLGTSLSKSINKAVFMKTDIHFRKFGQTVSLEEKSANTGIVYNSEIDTVRVMGYDFRLKPIRNTDKYLLEAMTHRIKYCRIVRKPFRNGYKYFLQYIMEGTSPKKCEIGKGVCGLDRGVSTAAYYSQNDSDFVVLADGVEKYEKEIKKSAQKYERRLRLNNRDCYNEDGTIKKGSRLKRTISSRKALFELKDAYRRKTVFIKQSHNILAKKIISSCDIICTEPMDYRALAKKSKELKRADRESQIVKNGKIKTVRKYKKRKRFGKSIGRRSPGLFFDIIEEKFIRNGGIIFEVDIKEYKASQYNHLTKVAEKPKLSDRTKIIGDNLVQRDLYSSFLLSCFKTDKLINFEKCDRLFDDFLLKQKTVVEKIKILGDSTKNFGINEF